MENDWDNIGANISGNAEPPAGGAPPPRKRTRTRKPKAGVGPDAAVADAPAGTVQDPAPVQGVGIPVDQLKPAISSFLQSMARGTKTRAPEDVEVDGMATNLSFGLSHTKFATNPESGPWTPLGVMVTLYMLPRAVERLMDYMDERAERIAAEEARKRGGFRSAAVLAASPEPPKEGQAVSDTDGGGPVEAVGARA